MDTSKFQQFAANYNYHPPEIIPDGNIHRFPLDGRKKKDGWYVLFADGPVPAGVCGDWVSGERYTWSGNGNGKALTYQQREALKAEIEKAKQAREKERLELQKKAAEKAQAIWDKVEPATNDHPYLKKKGVLSYGLRVYNGALVIPVYDFNKMKTSLQFIDADAEKRFLTGGKKQGCFFIIKGKGNTAYLAEGYATGATIHKATGSTVIVCFDAGNMKPVADFLRRKQPKGHLTICADDDQWTNNNPGLTKAREAATRTKAFLASPHFKDVSTKPSDFNDLHKLEGIDTVKTQLNSATPYPPPTKKATLEDAVLSTESFIELVTTERQAFLFPWLKEDSMNLVSGWRGCGKTWFALGILNAVTKGEAFGLWECQKSAPCLFLDGEMTINDDKERISGLMLDTERKSPFYIYSDAYANRLGLPRAHLADEKWRELMTKALCNLKIKLWVVDNLASLASGMDENSKQDWDPVNQWLLALRFTGISTVMLHHLNKSGGQRGTSAREDNLDISVMLKSPHDYTPEDGARFICHFGKARVSTNDVSLIGDTEFKLTSNENEQYAWTWGSIKKERRIEVLKALDEGMKQSEVVETLGISKGHVSKIRNKAVKDGYLSAKNKLTQSGFLEVSDG